MAARTMMGRSARSDEHTEVRARSRASFLSPPDFHRLDWACRPVYVAYGSPPYLVGSALYRHDYRDIDLRLILTDEEFSAMVPDEEVNLLLNVALSTLIAKHAGLGTPIDFQIVQMTAANAEFGKQARNPMGIRHDQREHLREEARKEGDKIGADYA